MTKMTLENGYYFFYLTTNSTDEFLGFRFDKLAWIWKTLVNIMPGMHFHPPSMVHSVIVLRQYILF